MSSITCSVESNLPFASDTIIYVPISTSSVLIDSEKNEQSHPNNQNNPPLIRFQYVFNGIFLFENVINTFSIRFQRCIFSFENVINTFSVRNHYVFNGILILVSECIS